jgi:hypothetical protein
MGLLSRFGRGLTEAAPIMGQMAQVSLLQAAEDKKYDRLLKREELAHERLTGREDLAFTRATEQATKLASAKVGAQTREETINYYKEGVDRLSGILETMIKEETDYKALMGDLKAAMAFPGGKEALLVAYNQLKKDQASVRAEMDRYDAVWKSLIDPEGKLPDFYKREAATVTTGAVVISAKLAAKEMLDEYGVDVTGRSTLLSNTALFNEEIKEFNKALEESAQKELTEEQKRLFKDEINRELKYAEVEGEQAGLVARADAPASEPSVDVDVVEPQEGLRALTPQDLMTWSSGVGGGGPMVGAIPPSAFAAFGRWLGDVGSWTIDKVKKIPVAEIMEWLNNFNRSQLERMGIDPDATPVGFGEAAMRTDTAPREDNLLSMIDRFTEAQRVA